MDWYCKVAVRRTGPYVAYPETEVLPDLSRTDALK
jgi:hypothetical protein